MSDQQFAIDGAGTETAGIDNWRRVNRLDLDLLDRPQQYEIFDPGLVEAVNTALGLGMPLLVTGEPGVGKSTLARFVAHKLGCGLPLGFRVKSTTEGRDLLYQIDQLRRMADAYRRGESGADDIRKYVEFNALGKAVLRTWPRQRLEDDNLHAHAWPVNNADAEQEPGWGDARSSVVLIDEIDKATTDVPNDLLEELRTLSFSVPELPHLPIALYKGENNDQSAYRPFVLITSNSERSLPEAFLRRCVYYHMQFPEHPDDASDEGENKRRYDAMVNAINQRIDALFSTTRQTNYLENRSAAWQAFWALRRNGTGLQRKPSTGELLNWLSSVCSPANSELRIGSEAWCRLGCQLLVKQRDDADTAWQLLRGSNY